MMTTTKLYARAGATAIAAVLALSSTPSLAQAVTGSDQPVTAAPAPEPVPVPVTVDPAPAPAATEPTTTLPDVTTPDATQAVETAPVAATPKRATTARKVASTKAATKPAAAASPRAVNRAEATAPVAAAAAPAPVTEPAPVATAAPETASTEPAPVATPDNNETAMIGGGALALLALGGGAVALSRRRRCHEEEEQWAEESYEPVAAEPVMESESVVEPAPVATTAAYEGYSNGLTAPSAFAWGNEAPAAAQTSDDESDRRPGETWVERAYRGPSPANPSVSLRARLKRAAFFDKRERDVAAGTAEPVDTDAGLPDNLEETTTTREMETA